MSTAGVVREIFEDWGFQERGVTRLEGLGLLELGDGGEIGVEVAEDPDFWEIVFTGTEDLGYAEVEFFVF